MSEISNEPTIDDTTKSKKRGKWFCRQTLLNIESRDDCEEP